MPTLIIQNLPEAVHQALEVRSILENAVAPKSNIAGALVSIGRKVKGIDLDFERDRRPFKS